MQYGFMVQGDFNFPAGQWKTPIGAKNVIGYGVVWWATENRKQETVGKWIDGCMDEEHVRGGMR